MRKKYFVLIIVVGVILIVFGIMNLIFSNNGDSQNNRGANSNNIIKLPEPKYSGQMSVEEVLLNRRSVRSYSDESLSLQQVSQVLWAAYGVSDSEKHSSIDLKTTPSAGATYPLEVYLLSGDVKGLEPGLYKYNSANHSLQIHKHGDLRLSVSEAALNQRMLADAPASIIYNAVYERITQVYGQRGKERYVMMDLGHSAQNVYLQATAIGLATCAVGAFDDKKLKSIVSPPENEVVLYLMPIGYEK